MIKSRCVNAFVNVIISTCDFHVCVSCRKLCLFWLLVSETMYTHAQVGAERYNLFTGCPKAKTATMVLRGGSEQFIDEAERSLHDAIMIVRRAMKNASVVPGGGAIDMEISK